ncbi:MAG: TonB-dependent receptor, partial [Bacteroidales bacterium]|nr:TonB-dependent receptor [Bacteroidales bacterium]
FRSPSIKELYMSFVDSNHDLHGNDSLKAETNNSYNTSITYKYEHAHYLIKLEPSFFFNDGKNMITIAQVEEGFNTYQNTNMGRRRTLGGNFNVTYLFYPSLTINAGFSRTGYSYSQSTDIDSLPDYSFYNNYTFSTKYNFRKQKLTLAVFMKYYGSTPHIKLQDGELVTITKDIYGDLEASVTKLLLKDKVSVVIGGKNLLDNKYIGYSDGSLSNQPTAFGRYYFIKLNIKLGM